MQPGCWAGIRVHILDAFGWDFYKTEASPWGKKAMEVSSSSAKLLWHPFFSFPGVRRHCRGDSITPSLWVMHQWQRWQKWKLLHPWIAVSPKSSGISSSAETSEAVQVFLKSSLETKARTPTPRPLNSLGSISFLVINNHGLKYLVWFLLPKLNSADTTTRGLDSVGRQGGQETSKAKELSAWEVSKITSQHKEQTIRRDRSSTGPGRQAQSHKHRQWALTLEKKLFQSTWFHRRV